MYCNRVSKNGNHCKRLTKKSSYCDIHNPEKLGIYFLQDWKKFKVNQISFNTPIKKAQELIKTGVAKKITEAWFKRYIKLVNYHLTEYRKEIISDLKNNVVEKILMV